MTVGLQFAVLHHCGICPSASGLLFNGEQILAEGARCVYDTRGGKEEESDGKALEGVSLGSTNANFNIK